MKLRHSHAVFLMVLVALLWSTAGVVTRHLEYARTFEVTFWRALFAAFLLIGLGTGFKAPVVASVLMAEAPAHVRAAAAGLNFSCIFLGQALGPFVLRLLVGPFGIQETFLITGGTLLMTAAAIALTGIGKAKPQAAAAGASA